MEDRISGLPDDLLHGILLHLHFLPAAVRTSLFSRRWRRVWVGLPELFLAGLHVPGQPPSTFLRTIDGALAAYSALNDHVPALTITVPDVGGFHVPACHVATWLRFASRYVAGTFSLRAIPIV
ncbi:F-box/LRR-repeat protein 25-like [Lolium perenne]|uniref:F-box/LRR-repeat protein 25-like n=1 Tax=Lolium perenne TaxID=4522 RepID=UPI003A9A2C7E